MEHENDATLVLGFNSVLSYTRTALRVRRRGRGPSVKRILEPYRFAWAMQW